jgi:diadenylate cyclase
MSLPGFGVWDVLDILIVAFVIYRLIALLRGTRAIQLIKGLAVLFFIYAVSKPLHLRTVNWLLQKSITTVFVALPIVFLPELRRALEQIGRGQLFHRPFARMGTETTSRLINEVVKAVDMMSKSRTGALIVIENETGLNDIIETGTLIDATVSAELLVNVFAVGTPLHDGAAIIRGDRLIAAACLLPLAENMNTGRKLGTRHRAATGISEQ